MLSSRSSLQAAFDLAMCVRILSFFATNAMIFEPNVEKFPPKKNRPQDNGGSNFMGTFSLGGKMVSSDVPLLLKADSVAQ